MCYLQAWLAVRVRDGQRAGGWTQVELAEAVGVSQTHLSEILNGWRTGSIEVWDRLVEVVDRRPT